MAILVKKKWNVCVCLRNYPKSVFFRISEDADCHFSPDALQLKKYLPEVSVFLTFRRFSYEEETYPCLNLYSVSGRYVCYRLCSRSDREWSGTQYANGILHLHNPDSYRALRGCDCLRGTWTRSRDPGQRQGQGRGFHQVLIWCRLPSDVLEALHWDNLPGGVLYTLPRYKLFGGVLEVLL